MERNGRIHQNKKVLICHFSTLEYYTTAPLGLNIITIITIIIYSNLLIWRLKGYNIKKEILQTAEK